MRVFSKYGANQNASGVGANCLQIAAALARCCLPVAVLACLGFGAAHAVDNDSINPNTLGRIEKNLRDFSQKARDAAAEITTTALGLVGVDYKFGGNTPDQGLDCSGFVRYVFQHATGIALPRSSREQARVGREIDKSQLEPGDLLFFNTRRFQFSHVGVYLGDNRFIHSPSRGGSVEVVNFDNRYWQKTFNGARRVLGAVAGGEVNAAILRETARIEADIRAQQARNLAADATRSAAARPSAFGSLPASQPGAPAARASLARPPETVAPASPFVRDY